MFVVKMKIKVLTEILPKILPVLTKNPSKMAFGRIFWKDRKDWKDSGNPAVKCLSARSYISINTSILSFIPILKIILLSITKMSFKRLIAVRRGNRQQYIGN